MSTNKDSDWTDDLLGNILIQLLQFFFRELVDELSVGLRLHDDPFLLVGVSHIEGGFLYEISEKIKPRFFKPRFRVLLLFF